MEMMENACIKGTTIWFLCGGGGGQEDLNEPEIIFGGGGGGGLNIHMFDVLRLQETAFNEHIIFPFYNAKKSNLRVYQVVFYEWVRQFTECEKQISDCERWILEYENSFRSVKALPKACRNFFPPWNHSQNFFFFFAKSSSLPPPKNQMVAP